jgi:hypothetical protein
LLERKAAHLLSRSQSDRSVSASKSATVRLRLLVPALLTAPWHTFRQVLAGVLHFSSATTRHTIRCAFRIASGKACVARTKCSTPALRSQSDGSVSASKSATVRLRLLVPALLTAPWHTFRQVLARVTTVVSTLALRSQSIPAHTSPPAPSSHPSHTTPHRREGVGLGLFPSRPQQSVVHCGLQAVYSGLHTASG